MHWDPHLAKNPGKYLADYGAAVSKDSDFSLTGQLGAGTEAHGSDECSKHVRAF